MADVPLMTNPMTTAGDVIYGGASGAPTRLAVGTAGQVLKVNAGATAPEWAADSGGTALVGDEVVRTAGDVSTSSTTYVDATGLSITLTTGAHRCLIGFAGTGYNNNATGHLALTIDIDGSDMQERIFVSQHATVSETMNLSFVLMTDTALTAASHTFKLRLRAINAGTATLNANASQACQLWVAEMAF